MSNIVVLKIGGSLLSKSDDLLFDFEYTQKLKKLLEELIVKHDCKFIVNVGGGYITRKYQKLAEANGEKDEEDVHRIGIATTNLNAELFHASVSDLASPHIIRYSEYDDFISATSTFGDIWHGKSLIVMSASQPGKSNDWNALEVALKLNIGTVIDVKDVDGVYTADPDKVKDAVRLPTLTWDQYLQIIGNPKDHVPGAHYPVDPIAARTAKENKIVFKIVGGKFLSNLRAAIMEEEFVGSVIT
jgi:predicted uridylate kinase